MEHKNLRGILLGMFALMLAINFASATITFSPTTLSEEITSGDSSAQFTFQITATVQNYTNLTWSLTPSSAGTLSVSSGANTINMNETKTITTTISSITQTSGSITGNITVTDGSYSANILYTISIVQEDWKNNFCKFEQNINNPGSIRIRDISTSVTEGLGDDETWAPFDEIEVEVEVENNGNDDIENIDLEWGLYDEDNNEWVIEVDDVENFDLNDDDSETFRITFTLDDNMDEDLEDLDGGDNYVLYVRATGEVDNKDNDDTCDADSKRINIAIERDFVLLTNLEYPEKISCGEDLTFKGELWNIGSRDQDDVAVRASVKGIASAENEVEISSIDSFESEDVELTLKIPKDAQAKSYTVLFEIYDEDGDLFEGDYGDDKESTFNRIITVESCETPTEEGTVIVSANTESGGKAGENLVIAVKITNSGDSVGEFIIHAAGYSEWADSAELSEETISLAKGESKEVLMTFAVNKDAVGDKMFDIEVVSGEELVLTQPVLVTIEKSGFDLSGIFGDNWYLWLIALVNLVLILIIIVVAVRISKKK